MTAEGDDPNFFKTDQNTEEALVCTSYKKLKVNLRS